MSDQSIVVTNDALKALRKEAKKRVSKPELPLNKTLEIVARDLVGLANWKAVTKSNLSYNELMPLYDNHPIFFWDRKDADSFDSFPHWTWDEFQGIYCLDLLAEKPTIKQTFSSVREDLEGYVYTKDWASYSELVSLAKDLFFFAPEYVLIDRCFISFHDFETVRNAEDIKDAETKLIVDTAVDELFFRMGDEAHCGILDFTGGLRGPNLAVEVTNCLGWDGRRATEFIKDSQFDGVVLVSPPQEALNKLKNVLKADQLEPINIKIS